MHIPFPSQLSDKDKNLVAMKNTSPPTQSKAHVKLDFFLAGILVVVATVTAATTTIILLLEVKQFASYIYICSHL